MTRLTNWLKQPATGSYLEQHQSVPLLHIFLQHPLRCLLPFHVYVFQVVCFLQISPPIPFIHFSFYPFVKNTPLNPSCLYILTKLSTLNILVCQYVWKKITAGQFLVKACHIGFLNTVQQFISWYKVTDGLAKLKLRCFNLICENDY